MKKTKKVMLIVSGVLLLLFISVKIIVGCTIERVQNISVDMPDLSYVSDGTYIGEYSVTPVYVKVEVSIKNHQLIDIAILQHNNGLGSSAEHIVNDIIKKQSLNIDAISGATVSSKCILKAVENAIEKSENGDLNK